MLSKCEHVVVQYCSWKLCEWWVFVRVLVCCTWNLTPKEIGQPVSDREHIVAPYNSECEVDWSKELSTCLRGKFDLFFFWSSIGVSIQNWICQYIPNFLDYYPDKRPQQCLPKFWKLWHIIPLWLVLLPIEVDMDCISNVRDTEHNEYSKCYINTRLALRLTRRWSFLCVSFKHTNQIWFKLNGFCQSNYN